MLTIWKKCAGSDMSLVFCLGYGKSLFDYYLFKLAISADCF